MNALEELRLAQSILEAALSVTAAHELGEVCGLEIIRGEYSGVDEDKFLQVFTSISKGTPLSGCTVCIKPVAAKYFCADCAEYHLQEVGRLCPFCGSEHTTLLGGHGFYLESVLC